MNIRKIYCHILVVCFIKIYEGMLFMKKTIVIADDDLDYCNNMNYFFNNVNKRIKVIGIAHTGKKTLELVDIFKPSFLMLDLNMPDGNGLEVINALENKSADTKIIVTSGEIPMLNMLSLFHSERLLTMLIKPFNFSLLNSIIDTMFDNQENVDDVIDSILHQFSFNFTSISYVYLCLAIKKLLYRPFVLNAAYKEIALEQNITSQRVKWGIEKLISSMIRYTPKEILSQYVPYRTSPSPKTFIFEIIRLTRIKINGD